MKLEIITPYAKIFEGEVSGVKVPGTKGSFEVLEHHAPIISILEKGTIRVKTSENNQFFKIDSGVIEVSDNKSIILAENIVE